MTIDAGPSRRAHVLFVCTGNICRSPIAEGLFRHQVGSRTDYRVSSAGLAAAHGVPPSEHAVHVMREAGIDISDARSQPLDRWLIEDADYVIVMTRGHQEAVRRLMPAAAEKTFLLKEFLPDGAGGEVADPIGGGLRVYRQCRDEIAEAIPAIIEFVERTRGKHECLPDES